jgi:hypothetical protein
MVLKIGFVSLCLFFIGCEQKQETNMYVPSTIDITHKAYIVGIHPYLNAQKM